MALDNAKNFAKATLSTGYDSAATSIVVGAGEGAKFPVPSFNAVWWNSTDFPDPSDDPSREVVRVTNVTVDTLTIFRGQEGTAPANHNTAGKTYKLIAGLTAKVMNMDLSALFVRDAANLTTQYRLAYVGSPGILTESISLFTDSSGDFYNSRVSADLQGSFLYLRKRGTTGNASAAIVSGQDIGTFETLGYDGTQFSPTMKFVVTATENFSTGHNGARLDIYLTPINSGTPLISQRIVPGDSTSFFGSMVARADDLGSSGWIGITPGSPTVTGYIQWRLKDDTRLGYMGFSATDIQLNLENSAKFVVAGGKIELLAGLISSAVIAAPATPAAGFSAIYVDSTSKNLAVKDDAGVVKHGVRTKAAVAGQFLVSIADDGTVTAASASSSIVPPLILSLNAAALQAYPTGTLLQLGNADTVSSILDIDSYGLSTLPGFYGRMSRGTAATPTAVQASDILARFGGWGFVTSDYGAGPHAYMQVVAEQGYTVSNQGARLEFYTTRVNTTGTELIARFRSSDRKIEFPVYGAGENRWAYFDGSGLLQFTPTGGNYPEFQDYLPLLNITAPGTPGAGHSRLYVDSTSKNLAQKNSDGTINHGVQTKAAVTSNWLTAISDAGVVSASQPAASDLSNGVTGSNQVVLKTSPTIIDPVITNIVPGADFTLTQNSVTPFKSINSGALGNALVLSAGNVIIGADTNKDPNITPNITLYKSGGVPACTIIGEWNVASMNAQQKLMSFTSTAPNLGGLFRGAAIRGTIAAPSATQSGDVLMSLYGDGYTNVYTDTGVASILLKAGSNWTSTNAETTIEMYVTANGSTSKAQALTIKSNRTIQFNGYGAGALSTDASGNITASDERLKNILHPYVGGLKEILQLQPITYKWKSESTWDTENEYVGFGAQSVAKVIPEAVGTHKDDFKTMTIQDRPLIAALVNAIKELSARVEELEAKIKES